MSRSTQFHLVFPEDQLVRIKRAAGLRGLSVASVIRDFVGSGLNDWERANRDLIERAEEKEEE